MIYTSFINRISIHTQQYSKVCQMFMTFSELNHIEDSYFDPNFDSDLEEKVLYQRPQP